MFKKKLYSNIQVQKIKTYSYTPTLTTAKCNSSRFQQRQPVPQSSCSDVVEKLNGQSRAPFFMVFSKPTDAMQEKRSAEV